MSTNTIPRSQLPFCRTGFSHGHQVGHQPLDELEAAMEDGII